MWDVVYFSIIPTFEPSRYCKCWIVCFYYRNLLGGLYREKSGKIKGIMKRLSSKKWENVGNSYIIPALLLIPLFLYLSVKYKSFYFFYFSSEPFKFSGCIHLFGDI